MTVLNQCVQRGGGRSQPELTRHRPDGSLCRSTEATPFQSNSFCWKEGKQRIQYNGTCATQSNRLPCFPSPVFVGEVDSQQDVLLCVLPPAGVHHHHVAHAVRPRTLQPHRLDGGKANRRRVNNSGNTLRRKKKKKKKRCEMTQT